MKTVTVSVTTETVFDMEVEDEASEDEIIRQACKEAINHDAVSTNCAII